MIYLLAGAAGDHRNFTADGAINRLGRGRPQKLEIGLDVRAIADELIASGQMKEAILVGVPGMNRYGTHWFQCSEVIGDYRTFVARDVVQFVDQTYRTKSNRSSRALIGHSSGASGALSLAIEYPALFGALGLIGPAQNELEVPGPAGLPFLVDRFAAANPEAPGTPTALKVEAPLPDSDFWAVWGDRPFGGNFTTTIFYSIAAAASPNHEHPPLFADLPVTYPDKQIDPKIWSLWLPYDTVSQVRQAPQNLAHTRIYLSRGTGPVVLHPDPQDILLLEKAFQETGVVHTFEELPGDHFTVIPTALRHALAFATSMMEPEVAPPENVDATLSDRHQACARAFPRAHASIAP